MRQREPIQMVILYRLNKFVPARDEQGRPQMFRIETGRDQPFYTLHPDNWDLFQQIVREANLQLAEFGPPTGSGSPADPPAPTPPASAP